MSSNEERANQSVGGGRQSAEYRFHEWFACPECDERGEVSTLAHETEMIFECHECGLISEFVVGEDTPVRNLDSNAIAELTDERTGD